MARLSKKQFIRCYHSISKWVKYRYCNRRVPHSKKYAIYFADNVTANPLNGIVKVRKLPQTEVIANRDLCNEYYGKYQEVGSEGFANLPCIGEGTVDVNHVAFAEYDTRAEAQAIIDSMAASQKSLFKIVEVN